MGSPADAGKKGPLDVVIVYAFDCTTSSPDWNKVNQVYWMVESKLAQFPGSCLSYLYAWSASNRYTTEKRTVGGGIKNILPESTTGCTKNMASGLPEAHRLISLSSDNPNGIILLFSDGSPNNKGDFFDKAEEFVSTVPVHTFTLGSDAYNQGLRTIAANSPRGTFNSIPIPDKQPDPWSPISRLFDSILSDTMNDILKTPTLYSGKKGPLDVVVVYAFDCTTATPDWNRVSQVYWMVQSKLGQYPGSCLSYLYAWLASNRYTNEKRMVGNDGIKNILPESTTGCTKNMASGLQEAHRLISLASENPNGMILLFSDGSANNKGDFFDKAEEFISTVPVHTFTIGSDAYNQGLCTIAANSPGGTFNSIPIPDKPDASSAVSLLLDGILSGAMNDDEKTPTTNSGSTKNLVLINEVKYFKEDAALTADTVTAEVEIKATSSTAIREGLDLVVVLDVSKRMEKKIDNMRNAMKFVIMKLTPVDRLSIVVFSDGAARLNPLRSMTTEAQKELIPLVDGLKAYGGTNIRAGLETGLSVVAGRVNTKARTANIFLMSDGKQTISDARWVDPGQVPVYTFGFGDDTDHQLLSDLAMKSHGGMFSTVPEGANLSVPFSQLLGGLLTVVAQNVQLTLTPKKDDGDVDTILVAPGTDYTQAVDDTTGVITIAFGTLFAGEGRKVIIALYLKDSTATAEYDATLAEAQHLFTAQGKTPKQTPQDIQILRVRNPSQTPGASDMSLQLQAELARRRQAEAIRQARLLADAGDLDEARYKLVDAQNALEDVMLNDGQKLVNALRAELVQLIRLMDTKKIYEERGRAYALASEASHGRQRYAARGGDAEDVRLFSTPRMDNYLEQAKNFEKDPTAPVPSAEEDVKQEKAANPLAAISGDLITYLRSAIEALQAMQKIIAASA